MKRWLGFVGRAANALGDRDSRVYFPDMLAIVVTAFFAVCAGTVFWIPHRYTDDAFLTAVSPLWFVAAFCGGAAVLFALCCLLRSERVLPWAMAAAMTAFGLSLPQEGEHNIWLGCGIALLCFVTCRWLFLRFDHPFARPHLTFKGVWWGATVLFLAFTAGMSLMGAARYYSFTYDTFDFGIFAQMFAYMKETGLPLTTVERAGLLSHFAVHFSPFFYLLLPGYCLFPSPVYLCVMQTAFVGAGVFAVCGIAKELGFSPKATALLSTLYLVYPALSYGLYYDFHENKFLTVCVLFTLYFLLKRRFIPFYICGLLLCSVKEDAAIYLVAVALFMLFHEKLIGHGTVTLLLAVGYFVFALMMIQVCGAAESMEFGYRYADFTVNGIVSFGTILKTTLFNFGKTLSLMFQAEKIEFLLWMFLPVLFTPFVNKRVSVLLLFLPMVFVNLMSGWPYQHNVEYQYTYGAAALILVAAMVTLRTLTPRARHAVITACVMLSASLTLPYVVYRTGGYVKGYWEERTQFHESIAFLYEHLPQESVIGAEGDVMPVLYEYPHLVLEPRTEEQAAALDYYVAKTEDADFITMLDMGFTLYAKNAYVVVLQNPNV
ncbi:MAG: DUF2079 domain-containing protein [Ruminococcaceae bacterium]|nr:DUF2079 domain-containing protein [Oscillospiraceae bacterium]